MVMSPGRVEVTGNQPDVDPGAIHSARGATTLALALLAPVVLVGTVLLAQLLQPPGTYDPVGQTVSTLAGRGAADRWVMSGALATLGLIFLGVAVGVRLVPRVGRLVFGVGATCMVVIAFAPQPAHGSSAVHMTFMVIGCLTFVGWPLAVAADRRLDARLRWGSLAATAAMVVGLGWLCVQAWTDGTWLGVAERVLLLAFTVWPVRMAAASWRADTGRVGRTLGVERMTLALALVAPAVFVVGLAFAQAAQPTFDPITPSLSALAGHGATQRWIMTTTLLVIAGLFGLVAAGLRRVPAPPRLLFALGAVALLVAALAPQPAGGSSPVHMAAGAVSWASLTLWPLALACCPGLDARLRRSSAVAAGVLAVLAVVFAAELFTDGSWLGLVQRIVFAAQAVWPIRVAVAEVRRAERAEVR